MQTWHGKNTLKEDNIFAFGPRLSAQDVLFQLKAEVLVTPEGKGEYVVIAIDFKRVFDNVSHEGILEGLHRINRGEKSTNYIRAFLEKRTAQIYIGNLTAEAVKAPIKGTSRGPVISPTLCNVAMPGLVRVLQRSHDV